MNKLKLIFGFPALLLAGILFSGCYRDNNTADAFGNFESTEVIVSAQSQGELRSLNLKEGDRLEKGWRVGAVDSAAAVIKRHQVLAQRDVTLAKLANLEAQLKVQEEQRNNIIREVNRLSNLLMEKAVPTQQVDDIKGQLQVLDAQIVSLKTQRKLIAGELNVVEAQLDEAANMLSKFSIINPVAGTVLEKYIEAGELVIPGRSLYKIADLRTMELKAYISGAQLSDVTVGDSVLVRIDNGEDDYFQIPGIIGWIASEVEFTPKIIQTKQERVNMVYAIKISIVNDGRIKIGMPGEVIFANNVQ